MPKRFRVFCLVALSAACLLSMPFSLCHSQGEERARTSHRVTATIIQVDDYGVYVPNRIFYWDETLGRNALEKLRRDARRLRNKSAAITFAVRGDPDSDRRPLVVAVEPAKEPALSAQEATGPPPIPEEAARDASKTGSADGTAGGPEVLQWAEQGPGGMSSREQPVVPAPEAHREPGEGAADGLSHGMPPVSEPMWEAEDDHVAYSSQGAPESFSISREEVVDFIQAMLNLNNNKSLGAILQNYGDEVDYYSRGLVNRDYIRRDMGYYFKNWDVIFSGLQGDVTVIVTDERDVRIATFLSRFQVRNSQKTVRGVTENIWKIKKVGNRLKLVGVKQNVLDSETLGP